jgi:hypothetical protein
MNVRYKLAEITERTPKGMSQRFKCACGKVHLLSAYVFAHWHEKLRHDCECGRINLVLRGVVHTPINAPHKAAHK